MKKHRSPLIIFFISTTLIFIIFNWIDFEIERKRNNYNEYQFQKLHTKSSKFDLRYYVLDPLLGWTFSKKSAVNNKENSIKSYVIFGDLTKAKTKIMVLGGSASDSTYQKNNWVEQLYRTLIPHDVAIINGAVAGYNSSQQLLKLIRDIGKFNPDIVISYDGFNEPTSEIKNHPFSNHFLNHFYFKVLENDFFKPLGFIKNTLIKKMNAPEFTTGPSHKETIDKSYLRKIKQMNAIAKAQGSQFIHILQPMRPKEIKSGSKDQITFLNQVIAAYPRFEKVSNELSYSYNLSNHLLNEPTMFIDNCHLTKKGNQEISEHIKGLLIPFIPIQ